MRCAPASATTAALRRRARGVQRERPLLVSSFDPAVVLIVRELAPAVPVGLLTWGRFPLRKAIAGAAHLGVDVVVAQVDSFALCGHGQERASATRRSRSPSRMPRGCRWRHGARIPPRAGS